jgi:hypothetical protein
MRQQFVEVQGEMVEYIETELPCFIDGIRKWTDNYGYVWFTNRDQQFLGESEEEL